MVIFRSNNDIKKAIPAVEQLGFIDKGDAISKINKTAEREDRRGFSFYDLDETIALINLHFFQKDHPDAQKNIVFRDRLRESLELRQAYEDLKEKLCVETDHHYDYTRAKQEFIAKVTGWQ